jgi:hypothetical protein
MAYSNIPNLATYGAPVFPGGNFPLINTNGNYWFVSSLSGSNGNDGKSIATPFATLAYAASFSGVSNGDVIIVLSGHTETVASNSAITIPANIRVYGQGNQDGRPTFTFSTANSSILFSGNNSSMDNFVGNTSLASTLLAPLKISANGVSITNFTWQDSTGFEAIRVISANNAVDLNIWNYRHEGLANGTVEVSAVLLNNVAEAEINMDYWGNNSIAAVEMITNASRNVRVTGSVYVNGVSNSAQIVRDYITSAPSTWSAYVFDGYAGTYVSGSSATGNGATGIIATGSGTAVSSNVNNIMANTTYLIAMEERTISTGTSSAYMNLTSSTNTLFTVTGGPILIKDIIAVCTAAGTSTNSQFSLQIAATTGGITPISNNCANATTINAGTIYSLPATLTANLLTNANGVHIAIPPIGGIVCPVGSVQTVTVANMTGTYYFSMRYLPLAANSTVSNTTI